LLFFCDVEPLSDARAAFVFLKKNPEFVLITGTTCRVPNRCVKIPHLWPTRAGFGYTCAPS
jgi:hypothetical protein